MLENIPTHLIAGPLGAGKTTLLRHLLANKPADERWAILVNEFGDVGIDAALLGKPGEQVQIAEIPGGCLCCVNGVPFQVGLGRLLRRAKPDRLFIEASGLGHPAALVKQLTAPPWQHVLHLQSLLMVLDAPALAGGRPLATSQAEALDIADLLILNKCGDLPPSDRAVIAGRLPDRPLLWCDHGQIPWPLSKPPRPRPPSTGSAATLPEGPRPIGRLWTDPAQWECHSHELEGWQSVGWLAHPARQFDRQQLHAWLKEQPFARAKGLLHTPEGWLQLNCLEAGSIEWIAAAPGTANRLELLFSEAVDVPSLERGLRGASL